MFWPKEYGTGDAICLSNKVVKSDAPPVMLTGLLTLEVFNYQVGSLTILRQPCCEKDRTAPQKEVHGEVL